MKTPDSSTRFQNASRYYHRSKVDDYNEAWDRWVGNTPRSAKSKQALFNGVLWFFAIVGFVGVIALICYEMR